MLFNSISFAVFLPVVFLLYWFVVAKKLSIQNVLLLACSYFFYACWDYRFLFLLIFSTLLDFVTGHKMYESKSEGAKKYWFWLSICINLGFLGIFKYYNFFAASFADFASLFGFKASFATLNVVLPVGISFYTFHGLSYVIDIYNKKILPERNFIDYAVFVSFFPLLVAGPIERATHLLPQIKNKRSFDYAKAVSGLKQILWGLFKKIVIADNCAEYADTVFNNPGQYGGTTLILGAVFFAMQIYGDFSGYSDIAIGTAKLFGIDLLRNFSYPYFSRDIAEFWRRWHISLSTWFRDYLYIPLGGSKGNWWKKIRNIFIIFIVSGFWHGANWTFIIWGALNALFILPSVLIKANRSNLDIVARGKWFPTAREFFHLCITFMLTVFAWIFFRSENIIQALQFIKGIFSASFLAMPDGEAFLRQDAASVYSILAMIVVFMAIEWMGREQQYPIEKLSKFPKVFRWATYYSILWSIVYFQGNQHQFIYFQF